MLACCASEGVSSTYIERAAACWKQTNLFNELCMFCVLCVLCICVCVYVFTRSRDVCLEMRIFSAHLPHYIDAHTTHASGWRALISQFVINARTRACALNSERSRSHMSHNSAHMVWHIAIESAYECMRCAMSLAKTCTQLCRIHKQTFRARAYNVLDTRACDTLSKTIANCANAVPPRQSENKQTHSLFTDSPH